TGQMSATVGSANSSTLKQWYSISAMAPDFKWPQVWTSDLSIDQQLPGGLLGTLEVIYGKDIRAIYVRHANLVAPVGKLPTPDGRPFYGGAGNNELNPNFGAGPYEIDNNNKGHNVNITAKLRKNFSVVLKTTLSYSFNNAI